MQGLNISYKKFNLYRLIVGALLFFIQLNMLFYYDNLFLNYRGLYYWLIAGCIFSVIQMALMFIYPHFYWIRKIFVMMNLVIFFMAVKASPSAMRVFPGYIGFFLLLDIFCPEKDSSSREPVPEYISLPLLLTISFSLSYSGATKFFSQEWLTGRAVAMLQTNPRVNPLLAELHFPDFILTGLNYAVMIVELIFFPLYLYPKTRTYAFWSMVVLFAGLFFIMKIYFLIAIMLIFIMLLKVEKPYGSVNEKL